MREKLENLNFNNPSVEETEEHQRMAEDIEFMQAYAPEIEISCRRARMKDPEKYDRLLEATKKAGINVEDIGADTDKKRYFIMKILGYYTIKTFALFQNHP